MSEAEELDPDLEEIRERKRAHDEKSRIHAEFMDKNNSLDRKIDALLDLDINQEVEQRLEENR
jgi:hypothetical protein